MVEDSLGVRAADAARGRSRKRSGAATNGSPEHAQAASRHEAGQPGYLTDSRSEGAEMSGPRIRSTAGGRVETSVHRERNSRIRGRVEAALLNCGEGLTHDRWTPSFASMPDHAGPAACILAENRP